MPGPQTGDEIEVIDEGLAELRRLCPGEPPNHYGTVSEICEDGTLLILFPDGQVAPYPSNCVMRSQNEETQGNP